MAEQVKPVENTKQPVAIKEVIVEKTKTLEKGKEQITANTPPTAGTSSTPQDPYKEMEFEEFIKLIGEGNINNWTIIAGALGVDRSTITRWKRTPQGRQAIRTAIAYSLQQMETLGGLDWKMHREKLKILGVDDKQVIETVNDKDTESLERIADTLQAIYDQEDERNIKDTKPRSTDSGADKKEPEKDKSNS